MDSRNKIALANIEKKIELKQEYLKTCRPRSISWKVTNYDIEALIKQAQQINARYERKVLREKEYDDQIKLAGYKVQETNELIAKFKGEATDILSQLEYGSPNRLQLLQRMGEIATLQKSLLRSKVNLERTYVRKLQRHSIDPRTVAQKIKDAENKIKVEFTPINKPAVELDPMAFLNSGTEEEEVVEEVKEDIAQIPTEDENKIRAYLRNNLDLGKTKQEIKDIMEPDWETMMRENLNAPESTITEPSNKSREICERGQDCRGLLTHNGTSEEDSRSI